MGRGDQSKTFLLLALFCWSTPSWLKVGGGVGGGGGPCDYCVSPSPKNWVFGFFRLGLTLDLGPVGTGDWGLGLGLDNCIKLTEQPKETNANASQIDF